MNILHIIGTPNIGGVQSYLLDLAQYDKRYRNSRNLLCLHDSDGNLKEKFLENGIKCIPCSIMPEDHGLRPYRFWKGIRKTMRPLFILKLFRTIRRLNPDIIVCEEPSNLNTQLFVSRLLRIPFIWHIHNEYQFLNVNKKIFNRFLEYYFRNNLFIITDSNYILKKNLAEFKTRMERQWDRIPILSSTSDLTRMINNSVDKSPKTNQIQLGSIGRLTWQKDYKLLIRIFSEVRKKSKRKVYLTIVGIGPLYDQLSDLIKKLRLEKSVKLAGSVERKNIPAFLSGLDIYVQSSVSEGSPLTIKEAMASALPIVSTNVGGISEMIIDGITGILVPKRDIDTYTDHLINLINMDGEERKKIGNNARNFAIRKYSIKTLAKKNNIIYKKIIKYSNLGNCLINVARKEISQVWSVG